MKSTPRGQVTVTRRVLLRSTLLAGGVAFATTAAGCATPSPGEAGPLGGSTTSTASPGGTASRPTSVLLAYFSRPGENYYYGGRTDLQVGNTEVLAGMIAQRSGCDVYRIEAADPYPRGYDATVQRNVREQGADARPAIANPLPVLDRYQVVLLASPIWNVRPPMIMRTFADGLDFAGRSVHPVATYAVSGLGTAESGYRQACRGATLAVGLAVRGEEVAKAGDTVDQWLRRTGLA